MDIALNSFLLLTAIIIGSLFLLGLGWLVTGTMIHGSLIKKRREISILKEIPLIIITGIVINYGLVLLFQSLSTSFLVSSVISAGGLVTYFIYIHGRKPGWPLNRNNIKKTVVIAIINLLILIPLICQPLREWDARSFWFFHGKMIFSAGSIGLAAGWQHPAVSWAHVDYPKLVPVMAGQIAHVFGYWNEFLPKLSLFFILMPGITWLVSVINKPSSSILILCLIPFCFYPFVWNGYMDGLLALLFSVSLLLLIRFFQSRKSVDLISSLSCAVFLINLKNEGILALISLLLALLFALLVSQEKFNILDLIRHELKTVLGFFILFVPFILWSYFKQRWNLINDLEIGSLESFVRIGERLQDGSVKMILKYEYKYILFSLAILLMAVSTIITWKIKPSKCVVIPLIAVGVYMAGITLVYLLTPHKVDWHLNTSVDRTMMVVNGGIIIISFLLIEKVEHRVSRLW